MGHSETDCCEGAGHFPDVLLDVGTETWVATESCCQISQFGSHYWELPSHDSQMDSDYSPLSNAPLGFDSETYANFFLLLIGLL